VHVVEGPLRTVSASVVVAAQPDVVFDLLADPRSHPLFDGSGTVRRAVSGPPRLSQGASFSVRMRRVVPYRVTNTVREFEENRLIAWSHFGRHIWRYELEPVEGSTLVTETWDWSGLPDPAAKGLEALGFPDRNRLAMQASLRRLKSLAEASGNDHGAAEG
jgi:uncharacterized protein YndB with AHSA1/START domain